MLFTAFEERRQSGQLPYVSELVEGSPALTAISQAVTDPRAAKAQASLLDENTDQRKLDGGFDSNSPNQQGAVLAACVGLATAVVATAAATASSPGSSDGDSAERAMQMEEQQLQAQGERSSSPGQRPRLQHRQKESPGTPHRQQQASAEEPIFAADLGIYDDEDEPSLPFLEESSNGGTEDESYPRSAKIEGELDEVF